MWQRDCEKLGLSDLNLPDLNDHILGTWGKLANRLLDHLGALRRITENWK